jgi:hypothetical protein
VFELFAARRKNVHGFGDSLARQGDERRLADSGMSLDDE